MLLILSFHYYYNSSDNKWEFICLIGKHLDRLTLYTVQYDESKCDTKNKISSHFNSRQWKFTKHEYGSTEGTFRFDFVFLSQKKSLSRSHEI
jgi:hypothetical protein